MIDKIYELPQEMLEKISAYSKVHDLEHYQNQMMGYLIASYSSLAELIEEQSKQMHSFVTSMEYEGHDSKTILKINRYQHTVSRFLEAVVTKQKLSLRSAEISERFYNRFQHKA